MYQTSNIKPLKIKLAPIDEWDNARVFEINRIQSVFLDHGWYATLEQCKELWSRYSEDQWCASWIALPTKSEEIYESLRTYIEE
jgi:hypothetical protein